MTDWHTLRNLRADTSQMKFKPEGTSASNYKLTKRTTQHSKLFEKSQTGTLGAQKYIKNFTCSIQKHQQNHLHIMKHTIKIVQHNVQL